MKKTDNHRLKHQNPLELARKLWDSGDVQIVPHALHRQNERMIRADDISDVILGGWHERRKDEYKEEYKAWNYSLRGEDESGRQLRIAITFIPFKPTTDEADLLLVITVINLDVEGE